MERDHAVTATVHRVMRLLSRLKHPDASQMPVPQHDGASRGNPDIRVPREAAPTGRSAH